MLALTVCLLSGQDKHHLAHNSNYLILALMPCNNYECHAGAVALTRSIQFKDKPQC